MTAIEIAGLFYYYHDGTPALQDVCLKIDRNRKLAILGANGSGKTTLLMHLNGLFLPQKGTVRVLGETVGKKTLPGIRQKVGILFDNPDNQLFSTTVREDVAFGPFNMGFSREEIEQRTDLALASVGMGYLSAKPPHNLSLGQKKKTAIAGLLSMDLELYAMDEPFSGLDPQSVDEFLTILDELHQQGSTLIISTHDVDLAYAWADEIAILSEGKVVAFGTYDLLHNQTLLEESRLRVPFLFRIFEGTGCHPRNLHDAVSCLHDIQSSCKQYCAGEKKGTS